MTAATDTEYWSVNLEPDDCEYCGVNYNSVEVSLAPNGAYRYTLTVGCYGSEEFESRDIAEFIAHLREQEPWFRGCFAEEAPEFTELVDALESSVASPHPSE